MPHHRRARHLSERADMRKPRRAVTGLEYHLARRVRLFQPFQKLARLFERPGLGGARELCERCVGGCHGCVLFIGFLGFSLSDYTASKSCKPLGEARILWKGEFGFLGFSLFDRRRFERRVSLDVLSSRVHLALVFLHIRVHSSRWNLSLTSLILFPTE